MAEMTPDNSDKKLRVAYDYCVELTRREARNFYYGIRLLRRERFASLCALYAFCREMDDAADDETPHEELFARRRALVASEQIPPCSSAGSPPLTPPRTHPPYPPRKRGGNLFSPRSRGDKGGSSNNSIKYQSSDKIELAFTDTMAKYRLPNDVLGRLIDTVESDLTPRLYATMSEVKNYAHAVASTVGLCSVRIFGVENESADDFAEALGIAFQWTNILRDIGEDHRRGRCYLPLSNLREFGLKVEDLLAVDKNQQVHLWWKAAIEQGREFFRAAGRVFPKSKRRQLRPALAMAAVYRKLLEEMSRKPVSTPRLSRTQKFGVVLATLTGLWNPFK